MYGLTREMSSKLERCMVTRETYTPLELKTEPNQHLSSEIKSDHLTREAYTSLEWKTKPNQHRSSNKNPDHLNISRVIETKLNQHLSSDQIRPSASRVTKSEQAPFWVTKSEHAPLE